jgi:hypothetical protein
MGFGRWPKAASSFDKNGIITDEKIALVKILGVIKDPGSEQLPLKK